MTSLIWIGYALWCLTLVGIAVKAVRDLDVLMSGPVAYEGDDE